jgi:hypothetical protein
MKRAGAGKPDPDSGKDRTPPARRRFSTAGTETGCAAAGSVRTLFPQEKTLFPQEKTLFPQEKTLFPQEKTLFPQEKTLFPQEKTLFPQEKTLGCLAMPLKEGDNGHAMRAGLTVLSAVLLVACGSSSSPVEVTTQINPNLPANETAPYPPPDIPPRPVLPPHDVVDGGDAAQD